MLVILSLLLMITTNTVGFSVSTVRCSLPTCSKVLGHIRMSSEYSEEALSSEATALCYSEKNVERIRGCDMIKDDKKSVNMLPKRVVKLPPLPCVTSNSCPYDRFKCRKGHIWSSVPGTPVCFQCPFCPTKKRVRTAYDRIPLRTNRILSDRVIKFINENNGTCLNAEILLQNKFVHKSKLTVRCNQGHIWDTTVDRLVSHRAWCRECVYARNVLGEQEYHKTATYFRGKFLRLVNPEERYVIGSKGIWQCENGHTFVQSLQNIRRRPGGKRNCSWCSICRSVHGIQFIYNPPKG
jgi:hypothetical protein